MPASGGTIQSAARFTRMHEHRTAPKGVFVGLATVDLSYVVGKMPRRNEKISVAGQQIAAGGPSANAAVTFAFLGGNATLVTGVGAHPLASVIREDLERFSVRLHDLAPGREEPPPVSSILVLRHRGERTVVSANAAVFSPLKAEFHPRWLQGVSVMQVDGHYMPLCIAAARLAHGHGIPVVLDSGSWKEGMDELLRFLDIVICSADFRPPGCRSEADVLDFLSERKIPRIAITRGASPLRFLDRGKRGEIPVEKVRPADTLGAGDIFHGAFCYYICRPGYSFRDSLKAAARVAAFSCRYLGTRSWMEAFPG
ncbi:MAG TPA: PfkB family carbohydrate kinase [Candidatus Binatia bacterium]|nr:PfkB family carbohydrate kinase [Candidatus Binatia bacterium]